LSLHIYKDGILRRLPLPPHSAAKSYESTKFLVSDQCVYALSTPSTVAPTPDKDNKTTSTMYSISKLDVGVGLINWQTLPPLPKIGNHVHISSRISDDGKSTIDYMWMRDSGIREPNYIPIQVRRAIAEANDWSTSEMHTTTQGGQCKIRNPPPARPL
ncbi:hypothetical protein KI387_018127, partial [Taxus chinensis]